MAEEPVALKAGRRALPQAEAPAVLRDKDWMEQARGELEAAEALLREGHYAWSCFTCQQAAEKALKAIGEHFRLRRPGHNLLELADHLQPRLAIPAAVRTACARLNLYYIAPRYPDALPTGSPVRQFVVDQAREAVQDARTVLDFAARTLQTPPGD